MSINIIINKENDSFNIDKIMAFIPLKIFTNLS